MNGTRPPVLLLAGMPTATEPVERGLARLRDPLAARGVAVVTGRQIGMLASARGWRAHGEVPDDLAAAFAGELRALAAREVERAGGAAACRLLVVASDAMLGSEPVGPGDGDRFRPRAEASLAQVLGALDARGVRLVLYTRRQDALIEAGWVRSLERGGADDLASRFPYRFEARLGYCALLDRLAAVPGVAEISVRPYEDVAADPAAHVRGFLELAGVPGGSELVEEIPPRRLAPRGYSRAAARVARIVNPHLETDEQRTAAREFLVRRFPARRSGLPAPLADRHRRRIVRAYAADNRTLFERFMPGRAARLYLSAPAPAPAPAAAGDGRAPVTGGLRRAAGRVKRRLIRTGRRGPAA